MFSSFSARTGNPQHFFWHAASNKLFFSSSLSLCSKPCKKKKRTKKSSIKNQKRNNNKKTEKVAYCLLQVQHTQVLQKEEKFKGFIHNLLIQVYTKYNHLSLSYISSTSTDSVPNKYISKPSKPKGPFLYQIFRECQHIALEKKKKVRPRSTKLTIITKQYEHRTRTAHVHQSGSCQVLHPRQKKLD